MEQVPRGDTELVQRALSTGDKAPVESSGDFDLLREQGNSLVRGGKFLEALQCYSRCIALCPENAVGYTNRALCHLKLNQVYPRAMHSMLVHIAAQYVLCMHVFSVELCTLH